MQHIACVCGGGAVEKGGWVKWVKGKVVELLKKLICLRTRNICEPL